MPNSSAVTDGDVTNVEGAAPATTEVVADTSTTTGQDNPSEGVKQPGSMLDAVQQALKSEPAAAPQAPAQAAESPNAETGKTGEQPAEELDPYKGLPFAQHPRFRQLLKSDREGKERIKALETENADLKKTGGTQQEAVQRFTAFSQAVRETGLEAQEVNDGFAIMAAMKSNPEQALQLLQPYYDALLQATGRGNLDPDLQQRFNDGLVDEATARELQQQRRQNQHLTQRTAARSQADMQAEQDRQVQARTQQVVSAVSEWEKAWQGSDPDFQKKHPLVVREINYLMTTEGYPADARAATAMAEKARKEVDARLKTMLPQRQEVRTVTGGATVATVAPKPKSMGEAIQLAARGQYQSS